MNMSPVDYLEKKTRVLELENEILRLENAMLRDLIIFYKTETGIHHNLFEIEKRKRELRLTKLENELKGSK